MANKPRGIDWKTLLYIVGGLIFILVVVKAVQVLGSATVVISDFVLKLFNFMLNVAVVILSILGPVAVIFVLGNLIIVLFNVLLEKFDELIKHAKAPKSVNPWPALIAGITTLLVTVVKENTIPADVKVLLYIAIGAIGTILTLTTSQNEKSRIFGFIILGLAIAPVLIIAIIRFDLLAPGQLQVTANSIQGWFASLTTEQCISMSVFVTLVILMIVAAIYYRQKPAS